MIFQKSIKNLISKKINKKSFLCFSIVISIFILSLIWYFSKTKEIKPPLPIQEEIKDEPTIEELLQQADPREIKPLTLEEQKEIEELLQQVNSKEVKPLTLEEQKEIEELLKQQ